MTGTNQTLSWKRSTANLLMDIGLLVLFLLAFVYLLSKVASAYSAPGYDFRFLWVAGKLWVQGINPYDAQFPSLGLELISDGNVPEAWAYPPSLYLLCVGLAQFGMERAAAVWALINVALLLGGSAAIVLGINRMPSWPALPKSAAALLATIFSDDRHGRRNLFFLHVFVMAILQSTGMTLIVGQTSILIFFGACLLFYGIARGNRSVAAIGLAILFLKPQVGIIFALTMLFCGGIGRFATIGATGISIVLSIPALLVSPLAPLEWVNSVRNYDAAYAASHPLAMTGIRELAFEFFHTDIGSVAAMGLAIVATILIVRTQRRAAIGPSGNEAMVMAGATISLALVPQHVYDFVLVGVLLLFLFEGRRGTILLASAGAALLWRSSDLARITGFYSPEAVIFPESRIVTISALLLLAAFILRLRERDNSVMDVS